MVDVFQNDHALNKKQFEFPTDNHWNEKGHAVAALAVWQKLQPNF